MDPLLLLLTQRTKNKFKSLNFNHDEWSVKHNRERQTIRKMEIKEAQNSVDKWINEVGVRYFNELTNMAMLTEEVGEVARIIARRYGEQSEKESDAAKDLGDELADVLFVLICLANQTGVDLEQALKKNLEKKTNRDSERHLNNSKLK
jgi:NTP pyrophosphatase (non-canonical NTP hydrolase)